MKNPEVLIEDLLAEASTLRGVEGQKHFAREIMDLVRNELLEKMIAFEIIEHMMVKEEHRERGIEPDDDGINEKLTKARTSAMERTAELMEEVAKAA